MLNFVPQSKMDWKSLKQWLIFFIKHYGKTRSMLAMSKKLQILGMEKLYLQDPKAFIWFFIQFLLRDCILYIFLPIWLVWLVVL